MDRTLAAESTGGFGETIRGKALGPGGRATQTGTTATATVEPPRQDETASQVSPPLAANLPAAAEWHRVAVCPCRRGHRRREGARIPPASGAPTRWSRL